MTRAELLRERRRRVRVAALRPGERCAMDIAIATGAPMKLVSHQLRILQEKGELTCRMVVGAGARHKLYRAV